MQQNQRSITTGSMNSKSTLYRYADTVLRSSHYYPLLEHDDAVFLTKTLDDCIYNLITIVDKQSTWFKRQYVGIAQTYIDTPADRNSYAASSDDTLMAASLLWIATPGIDWIPKIRNEVTLYRTYWLRSISKLSKILATYNDDTLVPVDDTDYVHARERCSQVEAELEASADVLYGLTLEVNHWVQRIDKIVDKMTCPYLRRVVVLAKKYVSGDPDAFLDNFDSGVEGIHKAIGRYDINMGAFAGLVDTWVRNTIITWVKRTSNPIRVPDRVHTHKRKYSQLLEQHPQLDTLDASKMLGISESTLRESLKLSDMQGMSPLIDESMTDDFGVGNEAYIDTNLMDTDSVNSLVSEYKNVLSKHDIALLAILFDVDIEEPLDKEAVEREAARQLLLNHHKRLTPNKRGAKHG